MERFLQMKELKESLRRVPFFPALNLLSVEEEGKIVGVSDKRGFLYRIQGIDYTLFEETQIKSFFHEVEKCLHQLPEGVSVSFLKRSHNGDARAIKLYEESIGTQDEFAREVLNKKTSFMERSHLLRKEIFLFLSCPANEEQNLHDAETILQSAFQAIGLGFTRLRKQDVTSWYYKKLNPSYSEKVACEEVFHDESATLPAFETFRSRLLLHPPRITSRYIELDSFYHAIANLRTLPHALTFNMVNEFDRALPDESEWVVTFKKLDQEEEKTKLRTKANLAHASAFFRFSEDHFAREKANQYEAFLHEMAEKGEDVFEMSLSVLVRAKEESGLREMEEKVLKAFPKLGGAAGVFNHLEHDNLFFSHIPLHEERNETVFPVLTEALSFFLPLKSTWQGTESSGILMKTGSDEALLLDLFSSSLPAKHAVMVGSTGAGKSFATNYLLASFLAQSPLNHVVVVDVGGSYRKLARVFQGSYLQIDCSEEYALNPFPEKRTFFPKEAAFDADYLAFLTTLLEKMLGEGKPLKSSELRILEKAILKVYERLLPDQKPLLGDIQNILRDYSLGDSEDRQQAYRFSKNLSIWTEGRFGKLLNRHGTLSLNNRFLVFDLAKLSQHPELQSILFFVIRSAITRKLEDVLIRKIIAFDEGWRFVNDEVGARLMEELYRTGRKYNALILAASQNPEEFLESKAATAILSNSYVKYVLKLQKSHELLPRFDLTPNEVKACYELESKPGFFSELFIKFLNRSVTAKIEPCPLEYWIASTDPEDLAEEEVFRQKHPELNDLNCLSELSRLYPRGLRHVKKESAHAL